MKNLLTILITAVLTVSAFRQTDTSKYAFTINQGKYEKIDKQIYLIVPTTLTNNSDDTLTYLSMSCSWQEFYYVDNDKMSVEGVVCTKNSPIILTLLPHKSIGKEIKLVIGQTIETSKLKFKIGMSLLKVKNKNDSSNLYDEFRKGKLTKNIIWSNTITQIDTTAK